MPKIKIVRVLTFSTEDPHHPASNILNSDPARKWKCANTGEKSASIVLQLDKAVQITGIDIGNENSAYIEVLVSRSSSNEFKPLLGMSAFMTPLEARNHQNINKVRMFVGKDFSQPESSEKWDRVKLVCVQPYNKHVQYGLSFVTMHTNEGAVVEGKKNIGKFTLRPDSPTTYSVGKLFSQEMQKDLAAPSALRGAAAIREASSNPAASPHKPPLVRRTNAPSPRPSTSRNADDDEPDKPPAKRNRNDILYDDDDEAPNEKIDRVIEKKKLEDAEKLKNSPKDERKPRSAKKTERNITREHKESRKRKTDSPPNTLGGESPKSPKLRRISTDAGAAPKPGPSASTPRRKRASTDLSERKENVSPTKLMKVGRDDGKVARRPTMPYERLLEGVCIVISGIQNPERANLRAAALAMGAKYKADWDSGCTHLICAFANTPKFNQVRGRGKIVRKQWILECEKQRKRLPWRRFCLDKKDVTGHESEDEVWEQVDAQDSAEDDDGGAERRDDTDEEIERIQRDRRARNAEAAEEEEGLADEAVEAKRETPDAADLSNGNACSDAAAANGRRGKGEDVKDLPVLANYFSAKRFYLSENLANLKRDLRQYIAAYDGKIIEEGEDIDQETLVITYTDDANEHRRLRRYTDRLISPTWVLECHNKKRLIPLDGFLL